MSTHRAHHRLRQPGTALVAVLYFLVVCALSVVAVLFIQRATTRNTRLNANGMQLVATAEEVLYATLAAWDGAARLRQRVGTTVVLEPQPTGTAHVYVTRLTSRIFVIVADARDARDGASRRVSLYVRVPLPASSLRAALIADGDVRIGADARVLVDTASCGDPALAALVLSPAAQLAIDPAAPQPTVAREPSAADSATYRRVGNSTWNDLTLAADVRIAAGAHAIPSPQSSSGTCLRQESNWGDPTSSTAPCASYTPIVFAQGDLTIDGGRGQGVLLVDGRLMIAGAFEYSGQIVARRGIETAADNIAISGAVYASRGGDSVNANPAVLLGRQTTIRYSGCDAWHGVASWLQPRRVRNYAWTELF